MVSFPDTAEGQRIVGALSGRLSRFFSMGEVLAKALRIRNDLAALGHDTASVDLLLGHMAARVMEPIGEALEHEQALAGAKPELPEVHTIQFDQPLRFARRDFERLYLEGLLQRCRGNIARAAKLSGLDRSALSRKLAQLGIDRTRSRPKFTRKDA